MFWFVCAPILIVVIFLAVILIRTAIFVPEKNERETPVEINFDKGATINALATLVRCKTVSRYNRAEEDGAEVVMISAKIEEELIDLDDEDRQMFLEDLGLKQSGLDQLIEKAYRLLGLETFFTAGEKECRAWTYKKGMKAPECAGVIHSDFERGFIRAETMSYEDFVKYGNPQKVKEAGRVRSEGKEYVVQDGDIMLFRFNV